ncbi:hypothetical protein [Cryptosporangium phraense]|uniref:hypothetical protein n=1 Tax=Cryptosporangium phraense TaxID=2593070 RepID=UPI00197A7C22|nr:hypothetical protein [Cryptosporangium phraense]
MTAPTRSTAARRAVTVERSAAELAADLAAERDLDTVWREDTRARRAGAVEHRNALADVEETASAAKRARRERATDARESEKLNALYRRATRSGERARLRARILGSAEVRALRIAKVRTVTLAAGVPVLTAFAAWSTTGVQAGVVRLLDVESGSAPWWTAWAVEPALIAVVALIIIGRAVLRSSGGDTDWRATVAEWTALGLSLALNIFGGWPAGAGWDGLGSALPHAIGPAGAAGTAFLIGLFDGYVSAARPWDGAPRLADLTDVKPDVEPVEVDAETRTDVKPDVEPVEVDAETRRVAPGGSDVIDPAAVEVVAAAARRAERSEWWARLAAAYGDQVAPEADVHGWMRDLAREFGTVPSYRKAREFWGRCPGAKRYAELRAQVLAEVLGQSGDDAPEPVSPAPAGASSHTPETPAPAVTGADSDATTDDGSEPPLVAAQNGHDQRELLPVFSFQSRP